MFRGVAPVVMPRFLTAAERRGLEPAAAGAATKVALGSLQWMNRTVRHWRPSRMNMTLGTLSPWINP